MKLNRTQHDGRADYPTYREGRGALRGLILSASVALLATACSSEKKPVRLGGDIAPVRMDRDGDGVEDSRDRCPEVKGPASNNGCPVARLSGTAPMPSHPEKSPKE